MKAQPSEKGREEKGGEEGEKKGRMRERERVCESKRVSEKEGEKMLHHA